MSKSVSQFPSGERIASIDALRGLTILVMIFVNDIASVQGAPEWMQHRPQGSDSMTFVDVVFPAFLFIVGMSIPFALGNRLERGISAWQVWRHVAVRTLGLLIIGVYMVNTETLANPNSWQANLWVLLMYAAVMMVWCDTPQQEGQKSRTHFWIRAVGILLLIGLAFAYRGNDDTTSWIKMKTSWWGILGLIGWAYLVSSSLFIWLRKQPIALMGMTALLYCVYMAEQSDFFKWIPILPDYVDIGGMLGSHAAITLSGVILGLVIKPDATAMSHPQRLYWALGYGLGLATAGWMLHSLKEIHPIFIIDKNTATPPWCLLSSAITVGVWATIFWLMDIRGWRRWAPMIAPAGQNPLMAYILAPIIYALLGLLSLSGFYFGLGESFAIGIGRSLALTIFVTQLTGFLNQKGLRLKL